MTRNYKFGVLEKRMACQQSLLEIYSTTLTEYIPLSSQKCKTILGTSWEHNSVVKNPQLQVTESREAMTMAW
jgi:hypothetical protein